MVIDPLSLRLLCHYVDAAEVGPRNCTHPIFASRKICEREFTPDVGSSASRADLPTQLSPSYRARVDRKIRALCAQKTLSRRAVVAPFISVADKAVEGIRPLERTVAVFVTTPTNTTCAPAYAWHGRIGPQKQASARDEKHMSSPKATIRSLAFIPFTGSISTYVSFHFNA